MALQYHQQSDQGTWTLVGPPVLTALSLALPLTLTYSDASTDLLPAHVPATVYGSSATQWDRTSAVWLAMTIKGSNTLQVVKEEDLGAVTGDYAIMGRILIDRVVPWQASSGGTGTGTEVAALEFVLDGGGSPLPTGVAGRLVVPFGCTLTSAELLADQSGSLVVDIWKSSYFGYPPSVTNTITASTPLTLSAAQKTQDTVLTGWTTNFVLGDILVFDVVSCATITACSVILRVTT